MEFIGLLIVFFIVGNLLITFGGCLIQLLQIIIYIFIGAKILCGIPMMLYAVLNGYH